MRSSFTNGQTIFLYNEKPKFPSDPEIFYLRIGTCINPTSMSDASIGRSCIIHVTVELTSISKYEAVVGSRSPLVGFARNELVYRCCR